MSTVQLPNRNAVRKFSIPPSRWFPISVSVPTVLQPLYYDAATWAGTSLYYTQLSQSDSVAFGSSLGPTVIPSVNGGVCLLHNPGDWWIYNPHATNPFPVLQIDADNEAVIDYYSQPLVANRFVCTTDQVISVPGDNLFLPNWFRTLVTIQNVSAAASAVRISVGDAASATATRGIRLRQDESITLSGVAGARERISAFIETGAPSVSVTAGFVI